MECGTKSSTQLSPKDVDSKWVFKIKCNSVFQAHLVACGYSQIPGINFTENFAPVMNDVTWHILLVAMIVWGMDAIIVDVWKWLSVW